MSTESITNFAEQEAAAIDTGADSVIDTLLEEYDK